MTDYRDDRTFSRVRVIEYEHTLLLFSEDLSRMFGLEDNEHIHWFIQDQIASQVDAKDGHTLVVCADDRTGEVLYNRLFDERHDVEFGDVENNFYALVMNYVSVELGYDLGPLVVDVQTPKDPMDDFDGALIRIVWTTFEESPNV